VTSTNYAVGRGKPPVHTRFKKGQSGNPGGKPGPAKLAKQCFRQALHKALARSKLSLAVAEPKTALEEMANGLVFEAACGRTAPLKYLLSLLDGEIEASDRAARKEMQQKDSEQHAAETPPAEAAPARNEPEPVSLLQGKSQGNGEEQAEEVSGPHAANEPPPVVAATPPPADVSTISTCNIRMGTPLVLRN
jgi:hypothetical protein